MTAFLTTEDILNEHGIEWRSTAPGRFNTICPECSHGRKKRNDRCLGVTIYPDGGVGWRCFHCDWSGGKSLRSSSALTSRRPISSSNARSRVRIPAEQSDDEASRIHRALTIWAEARDPRSTIVEHYLTVVRGLCLPDEIAGDVIRFHPALPFKGTHVPAMVALFRDIRTDEPCGIHRVFLDSEGRKIDRWMLGRAAGAAIKLDADENVTLGLSVGEGIETGIAGWLAGFRPVWALGSANAIGKFPVLPGIETITTLGENNDGGENAEQTSICIDRWIGAGKEAFEVTLVAGDDLNTVYREVRDHGL
jgi:hypothetical protein